MNILSCRRDYDQINIFWLSLKILKGLVLFCRHSPSKVVFLSFSFFSLKNLRNVCNDDFSQFGRAQKSSIKINSSTPKSALMWVTTMIFPFYFFFQRGTGSRDQSRGVLLAVWLTHALFFILALSNRLKTPAYTHTHTGGSGTFRLKFYQRIENEPRFNRSHQKIEKKRIWTKT